MITGSCKASTSTSSVDPYIPFNIHTYSDWVLVTLTVDGTGRGIAKTFGDYGFLYRWD